VQKALFYLLVVAALVAAAAAETTELAARAVGAVAMLLFLGATIPRLGTQGRLLVAIILPVGHALIVGFSPALDTWAAAMSAGGDFALLIGAVPLAASFIRMEGVEEAGLGRAGRKLSLPRIGVIQFGLSIALSIGSLWVARPLYDTLSAPAGSRYRTVAAAYSSNVAFSPLDAMVNLVLVLAGLTYAQYMPFGLGLALLIVAATAAVELGLRIRRHVRGTGHAARPPAPIEGLGAVLARTAALIALVIAGKAFLGMENEVLETGIVLALVSTALILLVHGPGALRAALVSHPTGLGQLTPAFALISSALFFAGAVGGSPAGDAIVTAGETLAALPGPLGALSIIVFTALLAAVGIHMVLTVATLGSVLSPAVLGISAPAFGLLLITSYIVAMNLSPFVPFTIASAEVNGGRGPFTTIAHDFPVWVLVAAAGGLVVGFL
jgi:hypothetical protein